MAADRRARRRSTVINWQPLVGVLAVGVALFLAGLSLNRPALVWAGVAVAVVGVVFVAMAALSRSPDVKAEEQARSNREFWSRSPLHIDVGDSPAIPDVLRHLRHAATWHPRVRVFDHMSTPIVATGPGDSAPFPSTQNGCDTQRFLVRWRSMAESSTVAAAAVNAVGGVEREVTGQEGWMILDGCLAPGFRFVAEPRGSTLFDVAVEVQRWVPSP